MLLRKLPRNSPILPLHPVNSVCYILNPNNQILQLHLHKKHWGKDWATPLRNNKGGIQSRRTRRPPGWPLKFFPRSFWSFQIGIINFFFFSPLHNYWETICTVASETGSTGRAWKLIIQCERLSKEFWMYNELWAWRGISPPLSPFFWIPHTMWIKCEIAGQDKCGC